MGMYDEINFSMPCPTCGKEISGFQSKDRECLLVTVDFWQVGNFYAYCRHCDTWVEFNLKPEAQHRYTVEDYTMTVESKEARRAKSAPNSLCSQGLRG